MSIQSIVCSTLGGSVETSNMGGKRGITVPKAADL